MSRNNNNIPEAWTPVQTAAWLTVHDYRRNGRIGAQAIGPLIGKSPGVISNEVNPDVPTHKLGLDDAVALQHATNDYRILKAMASSLHHVAVQLPDYSGCSDIELLTKFADWQARLGLTCQEIHGALHDGKVTPAEVAAIKLAANHHMEGFFEFLHRLESLVEEE